MQISTFFIRTLPKGALNLRQYSKKIHILDYKESYNEVNMKDFPSLSLGESVISDYYKLSFCWSKTVVLLLFSCVDFLLATVGSTAGQNTEPQYRSQASHCVRHNQDGGDKRHKPEASAFWSVTVILFFWDPGTEHLQKSPKFLVGCVARFL